MVKWLMPFFMAMIVFNSIGYGFTIWAKWDTLGQFVDSLKTDDIVFPLIIATLASLFVQLVYQLVNDDFS